VTLLIGKDAEVISKRNVYPLINATLLNMHIIGKKKSQIDLTQFTSSFNLQLYYLNERNLYFEPLIENFNLKFDYESENNIQRFKLDVFDTLLLNLTSASLDTLIKLSEEWSNLKQSAILTRRNHALPNRTPICIIKNETGSDLKCWIDRDDAINIDKQEEKYLYQKTVIQFDAYNLTNSLKHESSKQLQKVKSMNEGKSYYGKSNDVRNIFTFEENKKILNIQISELNELITLNLEHEGPFPWTIRRNEFDCTLLLDVSFSYEKGTKLVSIRSNINLINRLTRPLSVRLVQKRKGINKIPDSYTIDLNIGESLPVPLAFSLFGGVEIKPLGPVYSNPNIEFKWSKNKSASIHDDGIEFSVILNELTVFSESLIYMSSK